MRKEKSLHFSSGSDLWFFQALPLYQALHNNVVTLTRSLSYVRAEPSLGQYNGFPDQYSSGQHFLSCGIIDLITEMPLRHLLHFDKFASFTGGRIAEDTIRFTGDLLEVRSSLRCYSQWRIFLSQQIVLFHSLSCVQSKLGYLMSYSLFILFIQFFMHALWLVRKSTRLFCIFPQRLKVPRNIM